MDTADGISSCHDLEHVLVGGVVADAQYEVDAAGLRVKQRDEVVDNRALVHPRWLHLRKYVRAYKLRYGSEGSAEGGGVSLRCSPCPS